MRRPSVKRAPGDNGSLSERLVEVTFPDGRGCLVSLRGPTEPGGECTIEVYRADAGIRVVGP